MKDLFHLLTFRPDMNRYDRPYQWHIDRAVGVVLWALVITVIVFAVKGVISHRKLSHVPTVKKPWRYHYDVITANERAFFSTEEKMMLSEHGNIIDMRGGIYFENAKSIRLIGIKTIKQ